MDVVKSLLYGSRSPYYEDYFAYKHTLTAPCPSESGGWSLADRVMRMEFERFGLAGSHLWQLDVTNARFQLTPTYPTQLILPMEARPLLLDRSAVFRASQRIPVLTYLYGPHTVGNTTGVVGTLLRASQPLVGVLGARCEADEALVHLFRMAHAGVNQPTRVAPPVVIFDARPKNHAIMNNARGGGYENADHYGAELVFLRIFNIHNVRSAYEALVGLHTPETMYGNKWLGQVESSRWLTLISELLHASARIADRLTEGYTCLVVCLLAYLRFDSTYNVVSTAPIRGTGRASYARWLK